MRRAALAICLVACGGARPAPTVTVEPLPQAPAIASSAGALPPAAQTSAAAPEVLAPGRVTIVHFFATWCGPCTSSMPALARIAKHAQIAAVAISEDDEDAGVAEFAAAHGGAPLVIEWDGQKTHATAWHVMTMPTTYVVDKHGGLRFTHAGWRDGDDQEIAREVGRLLREP